jgi:hypothetical protein
MTLLEVLAFRQVMMVEWVGEGREEQRWRMKCPLAIGTGKVVFERATIVDFKDGLSGPSSIRCR